MYKRRTFCKLVKRIRWWCALGMFVGFILASCVPSTTTPVVYPDHSITYLVPFDPGGQSDRIVREQIPYMQRILGQDVVVDYKPGEGGALAWAELSRSTPDGYLLATINLTHVVLQPMFDDVKYRTDDLVYIATLATTPIGFAVLEDSSYQTLPALLDAAKAAPGTMKVGGFAEYTAVHMVFLQLQEVADVEFEYVAYAGGSAEQMLGFFGGDVDVVLANSDDLLKNQDKIKVLAMAEAFSGLPDVPTFKDLGFDVGAVGSIDRSVAVPAGTPEDILEKLETTFLDIARDPDFQATMQEQGFVPVVKGREETLATVRSLQATYTQLADLIEP